jgi:hypothetical protein
VDSEQHGNSESHAGIGVTAAWPRQQSGHADQTANLKLPTKRCSAVGIFALQGGEEVKRLLGTSSLLVTIATLPQVRRLRQVGRYASDQIDPQDSEE